MGLTRSKANERRKRKRETEDAQTAVRSGELLPIIRNEVTLQVICAKLPWATFRSLSLVSRNWYRAVQSGEIFASRAASNSAETFAVVNHTLTWGKFRLSLFSMGDSPERREMLPPIPRLKIGIPQSCECITWEGKLFILGGVKDRKTELGSPNVYMLNLQGGLRKWRKCASMHSPRHKFRAGIMNGKLYVCGGSSRRAPVGGTEVYDPEKDVWTALMPMPFPRTGHDAEVVDGELFVYGGRFFHHDFRLTQANFRRARPRDAIPEEHYTYRANHIDVYDPVRDNWRRVLLDVPAVSAPEKPADERGSDEVLFMGNRILHSMTGNKISVFDFNTRSWTFLFKMPKKLGVGWTHRNISSRLGAMQMLDGKICVLIVPRYLHVPASFGLFVCLNMPVGLDHGVRVDKTAFTWTMIQHDLPIRGLVSPFIRVLKL